MKLQTLLLTVFTLGNTFGVNLREENKDIGGIEDISFYERVLHESTTKGKSGKKTSKKSGKKESKKGSKKDRALFDVSDFEEEVFYERELHKSTKGKSGKKDSKKSGKKGSKKGSKKDRALHEVFDFEEETFYERELLKSTKG